MATIDIAQGFYESPSLPLANLRCINLRPNIPQVQGALSRSSLRGTEGISLLESLGNKSNRGIWVFQDIAYVVNGETLYRIDYTVDDDGNEIFSNTELGQVLGEERCQFADNGTQLMIVSPGVDGYIYQPGAAPEFQIISDPDFKANGNPLTLGYINSFFTVTTDENKLIGSAPNNGLDWNALDFASAEVDPDGVVGQIVFNNQLFVGGGRTFEVFQTSNRSGFAFQRIEGFILPKGLSGPNAITLSSNGFAWLGSGKDESDSVWILVGNSPRKISTTAIDAIIGNLPQSERANCLAMTYAQDGAFLLVFTFDSITLEFNQITEKWNERQSATSEKQLTNEFGRWRANGIAKAYNRFIVTDYIDGRIGELSADVYKEYNFPLIAEFSTIPLYNQSNPLIIGTCELVCETGVGNRDARDPEVRMDASSDGKLFNYKTTRKLGKVGEYGKKVRWRRLGRFNKQSVVRITVSDPVKREFYNLELAIKAGLRDG